MINLNDLLNKNKGEEKKETDKKELLARPRQIQFYIDLCGQKHVQVDPNHKNWTVSKMSDEISKLLSMKTVVRATQKQIDKILELTERLNLPTPNRDILEKMEIGKASQMIDSLIKRERAEVTTPTKAQLEMLVDMFLCPDINPLDIIPVHPTLVKEKETLQLLNKRMYEMNVDKFEDNGVVYTLKEVQDELVKKSKEIDEKVKSFNLNTLNRQDVGNFIQDNRDVFYDWKSNRITKEQIGFIQTLQDRISKIYKWSVSDEIKTDINGDREKDTEAITDEMILTGQHMLTEEELQLFSKKSASELIDKMQAELRNKENERGFNDSKDNITLLQDLGNISEMAQDEQDKVLDMFHKLYSLIGQEAEEDIIHQTNIDEQLKDLIQLCSLYESSNTILGITDKVLEREVVENMLAV